MAAPRKTPESPGNVIDFPASSTQAVPKPSQKEQTIRNVQAVHEALDGLDNHEWTDTGSADAVIERHGSKLRWCTEEDKAYIYSSELGRWMAEGRHNHALQALLEETLTYRWDVLAAWIDDPDAYAAYVGFLSKSMSRKTRSDILHLVQSKMQRISREEFDADTWILNASNGIIDLRTAELTPHRPEALCSKQLPQNIPYDPYAEEPKLFLEFLHHIMGGGPGTDDAARKRATIMVEFLQVLFGSFATGMFLKMMMLWYGKTGNNGKTTLVRILRALFGDYACVLDMDALMANEHETSNNVNAGLARLPGIRLAVSSEAEQGRGLNLARIKRITGGGKLQARSMRGNPFEFEMMFKVLVELDTLLKIENGTDPVWNRIVCLPFLVEIIQKDPLMFEKLLAELPQILAWVVRGAAYFAEFGLFDSMPPELSVLHQEYRTLSDSFLSFIEDSAQNEEDAGVAQGRFSTEYEAWCRHNAEKPLSRDEFNLRMEKLNY